MINTRILLAILIFALLPLNASAAPSVHVEMGAASSLSSILNVKAMNIFAEAFANVFSPVETLERFSDNSAPNPSAIAAIARRPVAHELRYAMTSEIQQYVRHYTDGRGRKTMQTGIERSGGMRERAEEIFAEEGVPVQLIWLAQVESGWKAEAVSPVGAGGVWQFMPATARDFGMKVDEENDERLDFDKATHASARYLRRLARRYDGNWELAIGAYNCGEGNMDKAIEQAGGVEDFWTLSRNGVLPEETAQYVPKVLAASIVGPEYCPTSLQ